MGNEHVHVQLPSRQGPCLIRTNYQVEGRGAQWVTLVTGIANDLTLWNGQVAALEDGFRILRYDLRGHGASEGTAGDYSIGLLVLEEVRGMVRRTSLQGYLGCVAAFLGLSLEDRLHLIRAPTHYVSGADDKLGGPPELMSRLAAKVPRARHSSVPKAAHIANIQNPGGFNLVLSEFLRTQQ